MSRRILPHVAALVLAVAIAGCGGPSSDNLSMRADQDPVKADAAREAAEATRDRSRAAEPAAVGRLGIEVRP